MDAVVSMQRRVGNDAVRSLLISARLQRQARAGSPSDATQLDQTGGALFGQGLRLFRAGQYRRAIITFERVRQIEGVAPIVRGACLYNMGLANLELRRFAAATMQFEQYLAIPGVDADAGRRALRSALEAAGIGARRAQLDARRAHQVFDLARRQFRSGRYEQALISFERVRQGGAGLPVGVRRDMLYNIGLCNLKLGRYATSVLYFEQYSTMPGAQLKEVRKRLRVAYLGMGTGGPRSAGRSAERQWESENSRGGVDRSGDRRLRLWNFGVGSAELKAAHVVALRRFLRDNDVSFLHPATRVQVVGHGSSSGSPALNAALGLARARAVAAAAVASSSMITQQRVDMESQGRRVPCAPNTSPENMARNRRVEVDVTMPSTARQEPENKPGPVTSPADQGTRKPAPGQRFQRFGIRMISGGEGGEGVGGGAFTYEVRPEPATGRSVMYTFVGVGLTAGMPAGGYGPSDWSTFTTGVPMRLEDFEGGGRIASAGSFVGAGASVSALVFYCGDLPTVVVAGPPTVGTGLAAGASWFHGWWELRD